MTCIGCDKFEQKKVYCNYCKVEHLQGICGLKGTVFLIPPEGIACEKHSKHTVNEYTGDL